MTNLIHQVENKYVPETLVLVVASLLIFGLVHPKDVARGFSASPDPAGTLGSSALE
jgi:hypothetical protein